jgi:4-amino-4-deoxy-L-arabinose transferase-like glycosyltransferase
MRQTCLPALGVALLVFAAIAPTLRWQEFSSGSENLNLATVLEIRRAGRWLMPTLQGQVRTQKPPLTAWITAAAVRGNTMAGLGEPDPARRDQAYARLAWDVRWTALVSSCAMLLATYGLGKTIGGGDARLGLLSAAICGSSLLFLRQARYATTDVQLGLWVTLANLCLAKAVLENRWWLGCTLGGIALGLALMSKGPVALVQSVVPVALFVGWRAWHARSESGDVGRSGGGEVEIRNPLFTSRPPDPPTSLRFLPLLLGLLLMLLVGLSWYAMVYARTPGVMDLWVKEVTRVGAIEVEPDPWWKYFLLVPLAAPWSVFLIAGVASAVHALLERRGRPIVLALLLLVAPVLIMSFFKDRKDRYLLPMAPAVAVLAARGVLDVWRSRPRPDATWHGRAEPLLVTLHLFMLAVVAVAVPVAGAAGVDALRTREGEPWYTPLFAAVCAGAFAALIGIALVLYRARPGVLVAASVAVMLLLQAVVFHGYVRAEGRSDLKPLAYSVRAAYPTAVTSYRHNRRIPGELSIYLNRAVPQVKSADEAEGRAANEGGVPVLFMFHKRGRPEPDPEPLVSPGQKKWVPFARGGRNDDEMVAFVHKPDVKPSP